MNTEDAELMNEFDYLAKVCGDLQFLDAEWPSYDETSLLENAVIEVSDSLQISKSMAITSALGAMAHACQGLIVVEQPTGNRVNTNLMLLTIAESGERKTSVEKTFFSEIRRLQAQKIEESMQECEDKEREHQLWTIELGVLKSLLQKEIKSAANDGLETSQKVIDLKEKIKVKMAEEIELHSRCRFIFDDTTPQALVKMMHEHFCHACLLSSEANGIFNGRAFEELHLLNSLWDGIDVTVDRTSRPSFVLRNARLTLVLMIQMQVMDKFLKKRGEQARGLGFLARFLVVKPYQMAGERSVSLKLGDRPHIKAFNERAVELLQQDLEELKKATNGNLMEKKVLRFSAKASKRWTEYAQFIESSMREGYVYEFYKDHASKLMDNITRVAGIITHFHDPELYPAQITRSTLDYAYHLCMRYSKHFLTYVADEPEIITNANALIIYLFSPPALNPPEVWNHEISDHFNESKEWQRPACFTLEGVKVRRGRVIKFTAREIRQYGPNKLRDQKKLKRVVMLLTKLGFVKQQSKGYRTHWELHESLVYDAAKQNTNQHEMAPEFKNGEAYSVSTLPLFEKIEYQREFVYEMHKLGNNADGNNQRQKPYSREVHDRLMTFIRCEDIEKDYLEDF